MNNQERRQKLMSILTSTKTPVTGTALARQLQVSRQVIVQDIAILRANGTQILSTSQGYLLQDRMIESRVFKLIHTEEQVEEELSLIVDLGGCVKDVFVYHKVYGVVKGDMNIRTRRDVRRFMEDISTGKSSLLMGTTSGYHYHTVLAEDVQTLDDIQEELQRKGFLAKLQDYEPVDFWNQSNSGIEE